VRMARSRTLQACDPEDQEELLTANMIVTNNAGAVTENER